MADFEIRFRLEPGCLGPTGLDYIEDFCTLVNKVQFSLPFAKLTVIPRYDKTLPEWEFLLNSKLISEQQAGRFLSVHEYTVMDIEVETEQFITVKVEQFISSVKKHSE